MNEKAKLDQRRVETLSAISGERVIVEAMAQRPRSTDDVLNVGFVQTVLRRLDEIEGRARQVTNLSDLDDLIDDAEVQGQFSAYLCPREEIDGEGELVIDTIEGWGVPRSAIERLRSLFGKKLEMADVNPTAARSALHSIFVERDAWADYVDDYEDTMRPWVKGLFYAAIGLPILSTLAFHFAVRFPPLLILGLLLAGAAGSSGSVMAKMPALDVSLSGELDAYGRRVLSRIGLGVIASLIGCASLEWLPVSVHDHTFADALNSCATAQATGVTILIILGLSMLLGFSERTLTSFEQRVFGTRNKPFNG